MKYEKPTLSFEAQADLLLSRGLIANREMLIKRLSTVSYYRLSGYLYPFRNSDDTYKPDCTLDKIWNRYTFDRQLRLLVLDAIERFEIHVRTNLVYEHAHRYGPFGYANSDSLPNLSESKFSKFFYTIQSERRRSREQFIKHFNEKYGDVHEWPPLWVVAEIFSYGTTLTMYRGVDGDIAGSIASQFKISSTELDSWLLTLNTIRNICAHHGRLWNRELGIKPKIPRSNKHPEWHSPVDIPNNRIFGILTICKYTLDLIAPQSSWTDRLVKLLDSNPEIPLNSMGFPDNWKGSEIWRDYRP